MTDVFVYGTLRSERLRKAVAGGDRLVVDAALLHAFSVFSVRGDVVPFIAKNGSGSAEGVIMRNVDTDQIARLDAYEGAFGYALSPVEVDGPDGAETVQMYLPPDDIAQGSGEWSFDHWQANYENMAVFAANELFSHDPPLQALDIRQQWAMIGKRAWSRAQLLGQKLPSFTVRHVAKPDDFELVQTDAARGKFFKFETVDVTHKTFRGDRAGPLPREGFVGVDAVLVLPYDKSRDTVLLIEQFRVGPAMRGDHQPWSLEPVAGMIDATETPVETAFREVQEEAGITEIELLDAGHGYPSPGSTTDYFYSYIGLCDLPEDHAKFGGLACEAEDLRLHIVPRSQAMEMIETGEINTGPLVQALYWLALNVEQIATSS